MSFKYRYTGSAPTVFIQLKDKDGHTWVPDTGDTVVSATEISHPLLELVVKEPPAPEVKKIVKPVTPETTESPVSDESKEK